MIFETKTITLKDGRAATLRAPALTDAAEMLAYIKTCCAETDFLSRYPEEYGDSIEAEEIWIRRMVESPAARAHSTEILELDFIEGNTRAQRLYEKMGLAIVGFKRNAFKLKDGTYLGEFSMQKLL